jgi:serine/threonine protein kinase
MYPVRYTSPILSRQEPMAILPGGRLGPYEIISAIGAGVMGEMYRARDTRLNRDVALKVIPEVFAADADRMAHFVREEK